MLPTVAANAARLTLNGFTCSITDDTLAFPGSILFGFNRLAALQRNIH
jgi:hypothetical protein